MNVEGYEGVTYAYTLPSSMVHTMRLNRLIRRAVSELWGTVLTVSLIAVTSITFWSAVPILAAGVLVAVSSVVESIRKKSAESLWTPFEMRRAMSKLSPTSLLGIHAMQRCSVAWRQVALVVEDDSLRPLVEEALGVVTITNNPETPHLAAKALDGLYGKYLTRIDNEPTFEEELNDIVERA